MFRHCSESLQNSGENPIEHLGFDEAGLKMMGLQKCRDPKIRGAEAQHRQQQLSLSQCEKLKLLLLLL